jgi:hypothetical protein
MRPIHVVLSLGCLLAGCSRGADVESGSTKPAEDLPAVAAAEQAPPARPSAAPAARLGGSIVAAGEYAVEVVASANGAIDAAVATAAGEAVAHGDVSAFEVTMQGKGEARQKASLVWDASRAVFHGMVAADAQLASGPFDVSLAIAGKTHTGRLELGVVLPRPKFGGRMVAVGKYSAEVVPKVDGEIEVHLSDAAGAAVAGGAGLDLSLRAKGKAGAMHDVALRWDAARARFVGRLQGDAQLVAGPIELAVRTGEISAHGRVELAALVAPPSIGGSMIAAGDYTVEVAPQLDGQIDAVVRNSAGVAVEGGVELQARVLAGGELRPVTLRWDPALLRFRGKIEGDFKVEPGPIELSLVAEGRLRQGAIMAAAVVPKIAVDAKAEAKAGAAVRPDLKAQAKAKADLAARLKAEAAAAKKAQAKAKAELAALKSKASGSAKLGIQVPQPSASLKAGASASTNADAKASGSTKATAKQQAGVKLGGGLSLGGN